MATNRQLIICIYEWRFYNSHFLLNLWRVLLEIFWVLVPRKGFIRIMSLQWKTECWQTISGFGCVFQDFHWFLGRMLCSIKWLPWDPHLQGIKRPYNSSETILSFEFYSISTDYRNDLKCIQQKKQTHHETNGPKFQMSELI